MCTRRVKFFSTPSRQHCCHPPSCPSSSDLRPNFFYDLSKPFFLANRFDYRLLFSHTRSKGQLYRINGKYEFNIRSLCTLRVDFSRGKVCGVNSWLICSISLIYSRYIRSGFFRLFAHVFTEYKYICCEVTPRGYTEHSTLLTHDALMHSRSRTFTS